MEAGRIIEYLHHLGCRKIRHSRGSLSATCPWEVNHSRGRDKSPSFFVKVNDYGKSPYNCFACQKKGLMEQLMGVDDPEYLKRRYDGLTKGVNEAWIDVNPSANKRHWGDAEAGSSSDVAILPESALECFSGSVPRYAVKDRKLSIETCVAWGLGHDKKNHRLIFPVRDMSGALIGATGRKTSEEVWGPKYLNYVFDKSIDSLVAFVDRKREEDFYLPPKSAVLYGGWMINWERGDLLAVEGPVDAVNLWQLGFNAVAFMGMPSDVQAHLIVDCLQHGKMVVTLFDADEPGRKGAEALAVKIGRRVPLFASEIKQSGDDKIDAGNASLEQVKEALSDARLVQPIA